eukprot:1484901-Pyramimonas_sp.AAC.1
MERRPGKGPQRVYLERPTIFIITTNKCMDPQQHFSADGTWQRCSNAAVGWDRSAIAAVRSTADRST